MRSLLIAFMLFLVGCHLPGQMVWSPDSTKAGYRTGDSLVVIDESGKVISAKYKSLGGMVWSGDSKTLYCARTGEETPVPGSVQFEYVDRWVSDDSDDKKKDGGDDAHATVVTALPIDGKPQLLFYLPPRPVWHMAISPDGAWLSVVQGTEPANTLYAFHFASKQLFVVSRSSGIGSCFSSAGKLLYVDSDQHQGKATGQTGKMVEATLDAESQILNKKELLQVLPDHTPWLCAMGDSVLFTSAPETYPGPVGNEPVSAKLYQYRKTDNSLCTISEDVGPLFVPSPDGKLILIEKVTVGADRKVTKRELAVIKPNGSDVKILRDITDLPNLPLWPSWKSNDQIVFTLPADPANPTTPDKEQIVRFEVGIYKLTDDSGMKLEKQISSEWPTDIKPGFKVESADPK